MVGRRRVSAEPTMDDALQYIATVKETFRDEPAKYQEFLKLLNDSKEERLDVAGVYANLEELMKDHQDLFLGFDAFVPPGLKRRRTIPPEAEQQDAPDNNKMKRAESFMSKLKTRFQSVDDPPHVYESFREILEKFKAEVVTLLKGHEDLLTEFAELYPSASTTDS